MRIRGLVLSIPTTVRVVRVSEGRRLGTEMVNVQPRRNGYPTRRRGADLWIATRLRFPVKTTADSGATGDIRHVVEERTATLGVRRGRPASRKRCIWRATHRDALPASIPP